MTDIIAKIMVELISILALAKKQISRGRLSKQCLTIIVCDYLLTCCRAIRKEVVGRWRDRDDTEEIGQTHTGRGPHDCGADVSHYSRSFG